MILFCGAPGSGKSTFWQSYLKDYVRVNNDELKTPEKCKKVADAALSQGKSVVIDNTNKTFEQRSRYIPIAKKYNVPYRCILFTTPKEVCIHNNKQRGGVNTARVHLSKKVPPVPIHDWFKNLEMPSIEKEGFSELIRIDFRAGPFVNDEDEKIYNQLT